MEQQYCTGIDELTEGGSSSFVRKPPQNGFERPDPDGLIFSDVLENLDPLSFSRLRAEISNLMKAGFRVEVAPSTGDPAYDNPERIEKIYKYLDKQSEPLRVEMAKMRTRTLGAVSLLGSFASHVGLWASKKIDRLLEPLRDLYLYGEDETDSMPWHSQRGKALALLTIVSAHELGSDYLTMSGPLDDSFLEYRFPDSAGSFIGGLSLSESLEKSYEGLSGYPKGVAREKADRRIERLREFIQAPVSEKFKEIVQYCTDSLGIRSRSSMVRKATADYIIEAATKSKPVEDMIVMSFGSGTALHLIEAMVYIKESHGGMPKLILIDQDPISLAAAMYLAKNLGVDEDKIEVHCKKLFSKKGEPVGLEGILNGREVDICEDSGLREYLPDFIYKKLTKESWDKLAEGGLMITGNMIDQRPQADFLHLLMGWIPRVKMRSLSDMLKLHREAGVDNRYTKVAVAYDGVYSMAFSRKPKLTTV